jgi:hypothetical protein
MYSERGPRREGARVDEDSDSKICVQTSNKSYEYE